MGVVCWLDRTIMSVLLVLWITTVDKENCNRRYFDVINSWGKRKLSSTEYLADSGNDNFLFSPLLIAPKWRPLQFTLPTERRMDERKRTLVRFASALPKLRGWINQAVRVAGHYWDRSVTRNTWMSKTTHEISRSCEYGEVRYEPHSTYVHWSMNVEYRGASSLSSPLGMWHGRHWGKRICWYRMTETWNNRVRHAGRYRKFRSFSR